MTTSPGANRKTPGQRLARIEWQLQILFWLYISLGVAVILLAIAEFRHG